MNIILEEFTDLNDVQIEQFSKLKKIYGDWNNKINIISRKDIDNIYERIKFNHKIYYKHGLLMDESSKLLKDFFKTRR